MAWLPAHLADQNTPVTHTAKILLSSKLIICKGEGYPHATHYLLGTNAPAYAN